MSEKRKKIILIRLFKKHSQTKTYHQFIIINIINMFLLTQLSIDNIKNSLKEILKSLKDKLYLENTIYL